MAVKDIVEKFKGKKSVKIERTPTKKVNFAGCIVPGKPVLNRMNELGLSCVDIATRSGISTHYARKVANGHTIPSQWIKKRIALALGSDVSTLWPSTCLPHPSIEMEGFAHIRDRIHQKGISIPQAAAAIGITPQGLNKIIRGATRRPKEATIRGIEMLLGIDIGLTQ